ncbi:magnesium transporter CorA family protein [Roseomonas sp. NAR14]|uniref:Magnesium transport protein CorA n=1 Tax=Roseomonas acroporae TaxID=2937791 RepID=A0A9X1YB34_9PROT|nr:magnesium transporter CorA family protein [Roseomonas acroporae]MCK8786442.1 magnesium transporter CorA family protein [Roseomonas acroporae]
MLFFHPAPAGAAAAGANGALPDSLPDSLPPGTLWLDLLDGTEAEKEFVTRHTGLRVPSRAALSEIETSSRLAVRGDALYLSTPVASRAAGHTPVVTPVGLLLSPRHLVTIRFAPLTAFDTYGAEVDSEDTDTERRDCSAVLLAGLLDAIVDRLADLLEQIGAELDRLSTHAFAANEHHRPVRADAALRAALRSVGKEGERLSRLRDTLLGVGRIVPFVEEAAAKWLPATLHGRFRSLRQDIASLNDYDTQLANKVQFLLDATLGFISIEQNNTIRLLTVVSIVGIPPTLVASIYGMNFKVMPELDWAWGYPYGLAMIAVSAILPLLWFRLKGWL